MCSKIYAGCMFVFMRKEYILCVILRHNIKKKWVCSNKNKSGSLTCFCLHFMSLFFPCQLHLIYPPKGKNEGHNFSFRVVRTKFQDILGDFKAETSDVIWGEGTL